MPLVPDGCSCPKCGEYDTDRLTYDDDGMVLCKNCNEIFRIPVETARKVFKT